MRTDLMRTVTGSIPTEANEFTLHTQSVTDANGAPASRRTPALVIATVPVMRGDRRSFDLGASAPALILRGIATGLRVTSTRAHRRRVEEVVAARYPDRLRIIEARSLFPQSTGSRVTFAVTDDADAVVRLRVEESTGDLGAALDAAVADALAGSAELRCLLDVFAAHGFPVVALESDRLRPVVVAALADDTAEDTLGALGAAARAWTRAHARLAHPTELGGTVLVAIRSDEPPARRGDADLPTPLRLTRAATARATTRHVAGYPVVDGVADGTPSTLFVRRDHQARAVFEERVVAQATAWLRTARPGAVATGCHGLWSLLPGRVAESTGHVLVTDRRAPRRGRQRPDHALAVTVDLDGTFTAPPTLLSGVRDHRGAVTLPPAPPWHAGR